MADKFSELRGKMPPKAQARAAARAQAMLVEESILTDHKPLPPPAGYASWLDYAVEPFDTWADPSAVELNRQQIRESTRTELRALRKAAARP